MCSCRSALILSDRTVYGSLELLATTSFLFVMFTWRAEMLQGVSGTFHLKTLYNLFHPIDRYLFFSLTEIPSLDAFLLVPAFQMTISLHHRRYVLTERCAYNKTL